VRWIVDYKSTDTKSTEVAEFADEQVQLRHRTQLEKYGRLMSQIDARPIKLAVYFPLLRDLLVSEVCLGSMNWGKQNSQTDANAQINYALDQGINFIDTAELYPVPPCKDSYSTTETYIGNWFANNESRRNDVVLASKIVGSGIPGPY